MDAELEKLIRELWADLRAQLDSIGSARRISPGAPLHRLEPIVCDVDSTTDTRLDRIEQRLARLERHLGLPDTL